jgi:glutamine synthetase
MKVKLEYVWLDGYKPEPNLRSKVKIIEVNSKEDLENIPEWDLMVHQQNKQKDISLIVI